MQITHKKHTSSTHHNNGTPPKNPINMNNGSRLLVELLTLNKNLLKQFGGHSGKAHQPMGCKGYLTWLSNLPPSVFKLEKYEAINKAFQKVYPIKDENQILTQPQKDMCMKAIDSISKLLGIAYGPTRRQSAAPKRINWEIHEKVFFEFNIFSYLTDLMKSTGELLRVRDASTSNPIHQNPNEEIEKDWKRFFENFGLNYDNEDDDKDSSSEKKSVIK